MSILKFFTVVLTVALTLNFLFDYQAKQREEIIVKRIELTAFEDNKRVAEMQLQIDSLKDKSKIIATTVVFLDSCQQTKTVRAEKSERRGRFVGGLLKGIFPGL